MFRGSPEPSIVWLYNGAEMTASKHVTITPSSHKISSGDEFLVFSSIKMDRTLVSSSGDYTCLSRNSQGSVGSKGLSVEGASICVFLTVSVCSISSNTFIIQAYMYVHYHTQHTKYASHTAHSTQSMHHSQHTKYASHIAHSTQSMHHTQHTAHKVCITHSTQSMHHT